MRADLKQLHERYGYKVWLTESSCGDAAQKRPMAQHLSFMREVLPLLDAADYVYRCEYIVHSHPARRALSVCLSVRGARTVNVHSCSYESACMCSCSHAAAC